MTFELGGGGDDFPFITYAERAWDPGSGETMHSEHGMWRAHDDGAIDVTLAHPIGVTEIAEGTADGGAIRLASNDQEQRPGADAVLDLRREYDVDGDRLAYRIHLATTEVPLFEHLVGSLGRVSRRPTSEGGRP